MVYVVTQKNNNNAWFSQIPKFPRFSSLFSRSKYREGPFIYEPHISEQALLLSLEKLTYRLFNGRCPKGNAAEAVAEKLDKKLRDNLRDARNSLFGRCDT